MKDKTKVDSFISVSGDIPQGMKNAITEEVRSTIERYKSKFDEAHTTVILRKEKGKFRKTDLMTCMIKLVTDNGNYYSTSTEWGAQISLKSALRTLEYQIIKRFEKMSNRHKDTGFDKAKIF